MFLIKSKTDLTWRKKKQIKFQPCGQKLSRSTVSCKTWSASFTLEITEDSELFSPVGRWANTCRRCERMERLNSPQKSINFNRDIMGCYGCVSSESSNTFSLFTCSFPPCVSSLQLSLWSRLTFWGHTGSVKSMIDFLFFFFFNVLSLLCFHVDYWGTNRS